MKRTGRSPDQSHLEFDLPLRPSPEGAEEAAGRPSEPEGVGELPLFPELAPRERPDGEPLEVRGAEPATSVEAANSAGGAAAGELEVEEPVTLSLRLVGGLADLAVHGGVLVLAILGQSLLGLAPAASQAPAYAVFLLAFSFLYCVVPMAFWGQTPGMASLGLFVRTTEGENLTFPQTALRWGAAVLTLTLLGLPLLVALSGRSLGDRWSRSQTHRFRS